MDGETGRWPKTSSIRFTPEPEGHLPLPVRIVKRKNRRRTGPATLSARVAGHITLESRPDSRIVACFEQQEVDLGEFSAAAVDCAQRLRTGVPLGAFVSDGRSTNKEIHLLVRRLTAHGLLEFRFGRSPNGADELVIEPQVPEYWPRTPQLGDDDVLVLSRFAYMRRRGHELVLESARAGALFKICNPRIAAIIGMLSRPQLLSELCCQHGFPGLEMLALLVDCEILLKTDRNGGLRPAEGNDSLILWDFHDLLFHTRSTEGRHANPLGGLYPYAGVIPPLPAVRPRWPGRRINLQSFSAAQMQPLSPTAKLLRDRHSARTFDDQQPIMLSELAHFLNSTARVRSKWTDRLGTGGPSVAYAARPYPSGGASYALELYLAIDRCQGLAHGFYHYDAGGHALVAIGARTQQLEALLARAAFAMGAPAPPQILITIAARFGRTAWKYSSLAYALVLKDVGVLTQTFYLMAADMGLAGCGVGSSDINLFAKMTGIDFHVEGPVGQFAIGRALKGGTSV